VGREPHPNRQCPNKAADSSSSFMLWGQSSADLPCRRTKWNKSQKLWTRGEILTQAHPKQCLVAGRSLYQANMRNHPHIITSRPTLHHNSALLGQTPSTTLHWGSRAATEHTTAAAQSWGERASPKLLGSIAAIERGQPNQTCSRIKMKQEA